MWRQTIWLDVATIIGARCFAPTGHRVVFSVKQSTSSSRRWQKQYSHTAARRDCVPSRTRNIGIIAHIDAGKTTTTERMLYYSGHTARIGDVDDGSTVTDFLPAERARGITIQSAAITLKWPPERQGAVGLKSPTTGSSQLSAQPHDINIIDTPGHADFTFEVLRSLRVLDGAVCILDGVAGVEAQTEIVWAQAGHYDIPRIAFVNKLDRDGASYARTVREIATKLHTRPAVCHIPYWSQDTKTFCGIGDAVYLHALRWEPQSDGRSISKRSLADLTDDDASFANEIKAARVALVELLSEHDDNMIEHFLEYDEDHLAIPSLLIMQSLRKCVLQPPQLLVPVFAGASFRNIGVQPLLDAVVDLLPAPEQRPDANITLRGKNDRLKAMLARPTATSGMTGKKSVNFSPDDVIGCALAFKVVNDAKRGVLVYVRVYHGQLDQNTALYNTTLSTIERPGRLLRMFASDAVEMSEIKEGHIGVIVGLKHTRTGDTLLSYRGMNWKKGPPEPVDSLQLRPIHVPPPVFFASIEPMSLAEEKPVATALELLLREDPSLHVVKDAESGQTHLSGMGELHLEIACDRLIKDLKAKATVGQIEIGYRESITGTSEECLAEVEQEVSGKLTRARCLASVNPVALLEEAERADDESTQIDLPDMNRLTIHHASIDPDGGSSASGDRSLPNDLTYKAIFGSLRSGAVAGLAKGSAYSLPVHSVHVHINLIPDEHITNETTLGAMAVAARKAVQAAIKGANALQEAVLLEPVMLATISVNEDALGAVARDISSARGGTILSLGDDISIDASQTVSTSQEQHQTRIDPRTVYAPPDPFSSTTASTDSAVAVQSRQIQAKVPLKELVGYLKHLRSLTGGRGTFIMQVDRFEPVRGHRLKSTLMNMRGW